MDFLFTGSIELVFEISSNNLFANSILRFNEILDADISSLLLLLIILSLSFSLKSGLF